MLRTFETEDEVYKQFKTICLREGVNVGKKLNDFILDYIKVHGDGNPNFTLDQFEERDFRACPALFRSRQSWENYYKRLTKGEYMELDQQLNLLLNIHNRNIK